MGHRLISSCLLALVGVSCGDRTAPPRGSLFTQWKQGIQSAQNEFERIDAVVQYFDAQWHAVSYEVMAGHALQLRGAGRKEAAWPYGESTRPYGPQEGEARRLFRQRYGLEPAPYFPPALKDYQIMAPPWADPLNLTHWRRAMAEAGLESLDDVARYLQRRRAGQPVAAQIVELLARYPGCDVERLDRGRRYLEVRLDNEFLRCGTDAAIGAEHTLVLTLCSVGSGDFIVKVTNWGVAVPNPVDIVAARELADLGAAPAPTKPLRAKHRARIAGLMRSRGISIRME
jgi:hypothetical protein